MMTIHELLSHPLVRQRMLRPVPSLDLTPDEMSQIIYGKSTVRHYLIPSETSFCTKDLAQYPDFNIQYRELRDHIITLGETHLARAEATAISESLKNIYEGKDEYASGFNREETNALKVALEEFVITFYQHTHTEVKKNMLLELARSISNRCAVGLVGRLYDLCLSFSPHESLDAFYAECRSEMVKGLVVNQDVHYVEKAKQYLNLLGYNIPAPHEMEDKFVFGDLNDLQKTIVTTAFENVYFSYISLTYIVDKIQNKVMSIIESPNKLYLEAKDELDIYFKKIFDQEINFYDIFEFNEESTSNLAIDNIKLKKLKGNFVMRFLVSSIVLGKLFENIEDSSRVAKTKVGDYDVVVLNNIKAFILMKGKAYCSADELVSLFNSDASIDVKRSWLSRIWMHDNIIYFLESMNCLNEENDNAFSFNKELSDRYNVNMFATALIRYPKYFEIFFRRYHRNKTLAMELDQTIIINNEAHRVINVFLKNADDSLVGEYLLSTDLLPGYLDSEGIAVLENWAAELIYDRSDVSPKNVYITFNKARAPSIKHINKVCGAILGEYEQCDEQSLRRLIQKIISHIIIDPDKMCEEYKNAENDSSVINHIKLVSMILYYNDILPRHYPHSIREFMVQVSRLPTHAKLVKAIASSDNEVLHRDLELVFKDKIAKHAQRPKVSLPIPVSAIRNSFDELELFLMKKTNKIPTDIGFKSFVAELYAKRGYIEKYIAHFADDAEQFQFSKLYFVVLLRENKDDCIIKSLSGIYNKPLGMRVINMLIKDNLKKFVENNRAKMIEKVFSRELRADFVVEMISTDDNLTPGERNDILKQFFLDMDSSKHANEMLIELFGDKDPSAKVRASFMNNAGESLFKKLSVAQAFNLCSNCIQSFETFVKKSGRSWSYFKSHRIEGRTLEYFVPKELPDSVRWHLIRNVLNVTETDNQSAFLNAMRDNVHPIDINLIMLLMKNFSHVDENGNNYFFHMLEYSSRSTQLMKWNDTSPLCLLFNRDKSLVNQVNRKGNTPLMEYFERSEKSESLRLFIIDLKSNAKFDLSIRNHQRKCLYDMFREAYPRESAGFLMPAHEPPVRESKEAKKMKFS